MRKAMRLSELLEEVAITLEDRFYGEAFWITCEVTDVKKYPEKRWCFLKFVEKEGTQMSAEIKGVFWSSSYASILQFEKHTKQIFASGISVTCLVRVVFHQRFGLSLEVVEIDAAYTIGQLELERQKTLEQLLAANKAIEITADGNYLTPNKRLPIPFVCQKIALITAPNSDGQRDFMQVLTNNPYGYAFDIELFAAQVQGDTAAATIEKQLVTIAKSKIPYDVVVIVRGGGSNTDFKAFDDFHLCRTIAAFHIPILTGIGHDRNTSIADMMARQYKTPTEAATFLLDKSFRLDRDLMQAKEKLLQLSKQRIYYTRQHLEQLRLRVQNLDPKNILKKGFAIVRKDNKALQSVQQAAIGDTLETELFDGTFTTTITHKK